MSESEDSAESDSREEAEDDLDPYLKVTRGFEPGLLVTFNESTDHEPSSDELEVVRASDDGTLELKRSTPGSFGETYYRFGPDDRGGLELVELDDEGHGDDWTEVLTIEVVGIE